jgi:hypothetical protein
MGDAAFTYLMIRDASPSAVVIFAILMIAGFLAFLWALDRRYI